MIVGRGGSRPGAAAAIQFLTRDYVRHRSVRYPTFGFGVRAWCKSVIETSHAAASLSINKIARFFF